MVFVEGTERTQDSDEHNWRPFRSVFLIFLISLHYYWPAEPNAKQYTQCKNKARMIADPFNKVWYLYLHNVRRHTEEKFFPSCWSLVICRQQ